MLGAPVKRIAPDIENRESTRKKRVCPKAPRRHREFDAAFIWASLAIAVPGGFATGAWLAWLIGTGGDLPRGFPVWIQAHGHLQLVGWVGLFIIGVSLFFMPRMAGTPIAHGGRVPAILWLIVSGLVLQTLARLGFGYGGAEWVGGILRAAALAGALLEWFGIVIYVATVTETIRRSPNKSSPGLRQVRPYFGMALTGWLVFATWRVMLVGAAARAGSVTLDRGWDQWAIEWFINLVLLPLTLAFSIRNLPHFLYRAPVYAPVHRWGWAYLGCVVALLFAWLPPVLGTMDAAPSLAAVARLARDGIVLWLVWEMNVFFRARPLPYVLAEMDAAKPGSVSLPWKTGWGRREWGRPEWLILSAYAWLVVAMVLDGAGAAATLLGRRVPFGPDWVRHLVLLGFVTLLILGMAHKLIPGFLHQPRLAHPRLPLWIFLLANGAVIARFAPQVGSWFPATGTAALHGFAVSGYLGMAAVALLGWNLWQTSRLPR